MSETLKWATLDNSDYIESTDTIIDDSNKIPTSSAVYQFISGLDVYPDEEVGISTQGQTQEGIRITGFILNVENPLRVKKITFMQTNKNGASWAKEYYLKISDPLTNREFISDNSASSSLFLPVTNTNFTQSDEAYLIPGRDYKVTIHSVSDHSNISLNIAYQEIYGGYNKHVGHHITKVILQDGSISEPTLPVITLLNSASAQTYGFKCLITSKKSTSMHIDYIGKEFSNVYNAIMQMKNSTNLLNNSSVEN